jgi:hypothetical protein
MTEAQVLGRAQSRELAHRETTHIEVSLLWHPSNNLLTLRLIELGSGREYAFCVEPEDALDAFNHPYVYLPIPPFSIGRVVP